MKELPNFQVRPLYLQVRDAILDRIKNGVLRPGGILPSEIDLHREFGVSLGTMRKALGVLEAEKLIVREPGRGTYVRKHQAGKTLSRFNPIRAADGGPVVGEVKTGKVRLGAPKENERTAFKLQKGEQVARFHRVRSAGQRPFGYELISVPERRFPGIALRSEIPSELEELAQGWGLLAARAEAKARTTPAPPAVLSALSLRDGAIVFALERLAFDTDDQPIELMTAYYDLQDEFCWLQMP